jgi:hypothetical protein
MVCRARPEPPMPTTYTAATVAARGAARRRLARRVLGMLACLLLPFSPAPCDERVLVGGLFDVEIWKTDDGSLLLSRNGGDAAPGGTLRLWAATEFRPRLQGFVMEEAVGGKANVESGTETELEQAFVRYTFHPPVHLAIEAGQLVSPIGNFSRRYLSSVNPLIGSPDSYSVSYPLGLQVGGQAARFDYRVALVDRPFVNENYVPETGRALRPALAAGFIPFVGTRLGAYATRGPYLGPRVASSLSPGEAWRDFDQAVYGLDAQFSRGYFELNGDFARSSYEVPGGGRSVRGRAYFIEPKYTWSPRFFTALRLERNDYAYVAPLGPGVWLATAVDFYDVEAGAGYRFGPGTILKVAYRRDRWRVDDALKSFFPDGYSLSAQLSYSFNLNSWLERPR